MKITISKPKSKKGFKAAHALKLLLFMFCIVGIQAKAQEYQAGAFKFTIPKQEGVNVDISHERSEAGVLLLTCRFTTTGAFKNEINIKWSCPLRDVTGFWTTNGNEARFMHAGFKVQANLASQAPVLAMYNDAGQNRLTIALSDAFHKTTLSAGVNEDNSVLNCSAGIELTGEERNSRSYQVILMLNDRDERYEEALNQVGAWWAAMPEYRPALIPLAAKQPLYSTWYSYHQNFNEALLLKECAEAHKLGYTGIIVDDGWQTVNHSGGYGFTGDWKPERLVHMADFVKKVHATGMKCLLWYSVPFMGYHAEAYKRFENKVLYKSDRRSAVILDPRYPEVRKFIVDRYVQALKSWKLDGFKLDFIDSFTNQPGDPPVADKEADYQSVYAGVDALMSDIKNALTTIKPDVLIEFRQSYTGPAMRKYGNMFRAGDCAAAALTNRIRITDIRLLAGGTAVHSDMLTWNYYDTPEIAALQFLNVIFSVPQLSVRLTEISASHLNMIQFYTRYWLKNKDVLINGKFRAYGPEMNYPMLSSGKGGKLIAAVYSDQSQPLLLNKPFVDIINGKTTDGVLIKLMAARSYRAEIFNCEGKKIRVSRLKAGTAIQKLPIPPSGIACLR
ncbi:glycoside hydrolase family 36 protein [Mucilaginibacter sabulilitoris]|uniref:Glycoside hydrolase family 36 protein n=1 Tax=Mucilaginibacter sabulilitoris TaxID=1173583 RepID=A0ABZ0TUW3_9SPHI|nr:glycoside hydrolase family 36 protein [Mucilaginibacter sabulilitoris]WPU96898.1 glycoside hydrolase family 36 protein [Mucilaginibacter sabulilitoris]